MKLYCTIDGCPNFVNTSGKVNSDATFTCRDHNPPGEENAHFQESQLDPDLRRSHKPVGTEHIRRQGSETNDFYGEDLQSLESLNELDPLDLEDFNDE